MTTKTFFVRKRSRFGYIITEMLQLIYKPAANSSSIHRNMNFTKTDALEVPNYPFDQANDLYQIELNILAPGKDILSDPGVNNRRLISEASDIYRYMRDFHELTLHANDLTKTPPVD